MTKSAYRSGSLVILDCVLVGFLISVFIIYNDLLKAESIYQ